MVDLTAYQGQSIKVKFVRTLGVIGLDRIRPQVIFPGFTVASTSSLSGRLLSMRNAALKATEKQPVVVKVTGTEENPTKLPKGIGRKVTGTFALPLFLKGKGEPGSPMTYDKDGTTPKATGTTYQAGFTCMLTNAQLGNELGGKARAVVYGHGLLGSRDEVASPPPRRCW